MLWGIAPLWEGRGALEYLQAEQRDWDAGAFEDAGRGARAQEVRCLPHNPSCNPRQTPDVGKATASFHPTPPPVNPASSLLKSLARAPSVIRFITRCPLKSVQPTKEI